MENQQISKYTCEELLAKLAELNIDVAVIEHPPLRTVEESRQLRGDLPGGHVKNLFLKDKRKQFWLVVALEDTSIDLKETAALLDAGKFSFASPAELDEILGLVPGAVSPLALFNDRPKAVQLVLDERLLEATPLNFHPLRNDRTVAIEVPDLMRFLDAIEHKPLIVSLPARAV
jgi:Ala-tRNA(Pro) deacylase